MARHIASRSVTCDEGDTVRRVSRHVPSLFRGRVGVTADQPVQSEVSARRGEQQGVLEQPPAALNELTQTSHPARAEERGRHKAPQQSSIRFLRAGLTRYGFVVGTNTR